KLQKGVFIMELNYKSQGRKSYDYNDLMVERKVMQTQAIRVAKKDFNKTLKKCILLDALYIQTGVSPNEYESERLIEAMAANILKKIGGVELYCNYNGAIYDIEDALTGFIEAESDKVFEKVLDKVK